MIVFKKLILLKSVKTVKDLIQAIEFHYQIKKALIIN